MTSTVSNDFGRYGGSYLLSNNAYEDYVQGKETIGRPDGQFMIPLNQMNDLIKNHPNDPREWEQQLGLNPNSLGDSNIRRVDVYNLENYEPRLPTKNLSGSNNQFINGGKVPGGQDECVINPFPNPESNPHVGRITILTKPEISQNEGNAKSISSSNIESLNGGGARAPNIAEIHNEPFNPADYIPKNKPSETTGVGIGTGIE